MKPSYLIPFIFVFLLVPFISKAQFKYEREFRIKYEQIPLAARYFIDSIGPTAKIKWYKEIGINSVSYEAKFKFRNKKYSVEFDTLGVLQDVEYIIKKKAINPIIYEQIEQTLDSLYQKWKIQKIQLQYKGQSKDILMAIHQEKNSHQITTSYEIVVRGKAQGIVQLYEISFSEQGVMNNISQIIQNKADHLEY
jgi:hypothetical protein